MSNDTKTIKTAVLLSGGGRTLDNFLHHIRDRQLPATIDLVISSTPHARGLTVARAAGISAHVITPREKTVETFSREITAALETVAPHLVCMAGFLSFYQIPDAYLGRVLNIHPALLPAFGGRGMYGHHVHEAVLAAGCKISGCTVHFADNLYDHGPIIIQRAVPVCEDDTPDTLAARVFEEEKIAYPEAVRLFAENRLKIDGRRVRIAGAADSTPAPSPAMD